MTLRILMPCDAIREPLTGVGRMAFTLLRGLSELGHEVIPLDWQDNPLARRATGRCAVLPPRLAQLRTPLWHFDLLRRIDTLGIDHDVLLNPTGYPNVLGSHRCLVMVVHDLHMLQRSSYRRGKRTWFRAFLGRGLHRAARLVCVSQHTRAALLDRYDLDPARVAVVPNALAPEFLDAADPPTEPAEDGRYLLSVGTLETRKNVHRLLDAFARCRATGLDAKLVFAGRLGHGSEMLQARLRLQHLAGAVEIVSDCSDARLRSLYRGAVALLFPSLEEGFGLPILEAMHLGTPVLTSSVSATAEVAGDAALLIDPTDTDALVDGITRLCGDPQLCAALRERGRRRAAAFHPRLQAEAYSAQLDAALERTAAMSACTT